MKKDVKQIVTDQIIELIEEHGANWTQPFASLCGAPRNALTGNKYRGLNALLLALSRTSYAASVKQWAKLGYSCKGLGKKDKDLGIRISVPILLKDKETGKKKGLIFGSSTVFRAEDVASFEDGSPYQPPLVETVDTTTKLALVDQYIANTGADIRHNPVGGAYYRISEDFINLPLREQFSATETSNATETYYSTKLHELTHWTGHKSRCDRLDLKNRKGYAFEELVAEIGASILCVELGVSPVVREDHAQYIASWLQSLGDDKSYIFNAASAAQKAVDFLDGTQAQEERQVA